MGLFSTIGNIGNTTKLNKLGFLKERTTHYERFDNYYYSSVLNAGDIVSLLDNEMKSLTKLSISPLSDSYQISMGSTIVDFIELPQEGEKYVSKLSLNHYKSDDPTWLAFLNALYTNVEQILLNSDPNSEVSRNEKAMKTTTKYSGGGLGGLILNPLINTGTKIYNENKYKNDQERLKNQGLNPPIKLSEDFV